MLIKKVFFYMLLVFVIPLGVNAQSGLGVGATLASSAIAKETAESLIESARREATRLMAEAENTGNVMLVRASDELNLSAENVSRLLSNETSKIFEELEVDKRDMLLGLASATAAAQELGAHAYTLKDTLALDLRSILGNIPFVKEHLMLQRISGLSLIRGRQNYEIDLIGSYVGLPGEGHRTELSVLIDGSPVEGLEVDPQELHLARIRVSAEELDEYFSEDSEVRLPVTLGIRQSFDERLLGFLWKVERVKQYESDINLTLYPNFAGEIEVVARHQRYGWKEIDPLERSMTHSDHCSSSCGDHWGTSHVVAVTERGNSSTPQVGDRRITAASCRRTAGRAGYSVAEGTRVSQDQSRATCQIRFRTHSQTFTLFAEREEYVAVDERDEKISTKVYFDSLAEVRIPKSTSAIFLRGRLITGDPVDLLASEISNASPVEVVRKVSNTDDDSLFLRARRPQGL